MTSMQQRGIIQPHLSPYVTRPSHRPNDHVYHLCELHADIRVHSKYSNYGLAAPSRCLHFLSGRYPLSEQKNNEPKPGKVVKVEHIGTRTSPLTFLSRQLRTVVVL